MRGTQAARPKPHVPWTHLRCRWEDTPESWLSLWREIHGLSRPPDIDAFEKSLQARFTGPWQEIFALLIARPSACRAVAEGLKIDSQAAPEAVCSNIHGLVMSYRQPPSPRCSSLVWQSTTGMPGTLGPPSTALELDAQERAHRAACKWLLDGRRRRVGTVARELLDGKPKDHHTRDLCKTLLATALEAERLRAQPVGAPLTDTIDQILCDHQPDGRELRNLRLPDPRLKIPERIRTLICWLNRVLAPLYPGRPISHTTEDAPSAAVRSRERTRMILRLLRHALGRGEMVLSVQDVFHTLGE